MKHFSYIIIFLFLVFAGFSQSRKLSFTQHEAGILIGGAYYIGDLNPTNHFNLVQPAAGIFYRFTPNYRYAFRLGFNYGSIMGDDSQSSDVDQLQRNLNFKSKIMDLHLLAEFNFLEYRISNDKYKFTTFLFLGVSGYHFNPQGRIDNQWIDLAPLATEGQSKKYKLNQLSVPFGIGLKINVSQLVGIGLEWAPRKTFTDYLDDVSGTYPDPSQRPFKSELAQRLSDRSKTTSSNVNKQRGNPRTKDWYVFFGITVNIKLTLIAPPCYTEY